MKDEFAGVLLHLINSWLRCATIKYELPKASQVNLRVFDILGREVAVLVNERRETGTVVGDSGAILRTTMAAQQPALDGGTFVRCGRRTFKEGNIWERNQKIHS